MSRNEFEGATAVVTGGGAGLGRATALALAQKRAKVVVANRNADAGESTAAAIRDMGGEALFVRTDVSKSEDVRNLFDATIGRFGGIDILVNNAGVLGEQVPMADSTEENWDHVINTNLKGAWLCMRHAIPQMVKQGRGAIINVASATAVRTFAGLSIYSASKAGLTAMTRVAAVEYARSGVTIKSICVGGMRTPMTEQIRSLPNGDAMLAGLHPINRIAEPEEIASAILWLCSNEASFVIGPALYATGGMEIA